MEFVAIDVETSNPKRASICQIGLAMYRDSRLVDEWSSLIDPEDYFHSMNIGVHGITEEDVMGAPTFIDVMPDLERFMSGAVCVSHSPFDRTSIHQALERYSLSSIDATWLDSVLVARRTWEASSYDLANVCKIIGYDFKHHDALEDAKACGHIVVTAMEKTGLDIEAWLKRVKQPINSANSSSGATVKRDGNPEGVLYGEILVFTGALEIPRQEAADLAASIGCTVKTSVTKKTTLLVVGDHDITKLAGKDKSSKHIKAEQLISEGQNIRVVGESDFKELVGQANEIE